MRIVVRGIPAPQGSKRPVRLGNGKTGMVESSRAVGPWREAVRGECQRAEVVPIPGPVMVGLIFWMPRPAGHYRTGRYAGQLKDSAPAFPATKKNDIDKLSRSTLDGLTMGGAYWDDGQVIVLEARKLFANPGIPVGCEIEVRPLTEDS